MDLKEAMAISLSLTKPLRAARDGRPFHMACAKRVLKGGLA
jgi:hypothetical protein